MAAKDIYEINNIVMGDISKRDKYVITPPDGEVDFPESFQSIPVSMKGFAAVVINEPTRDVGSSDLDEAEA